MAAIQADPDVLADLDLAPFTKVRGESGQMRVGDRYVIEITGPWKGAVEVVDVSPRSFRLTTLEGHMESGVIDMRTSTRTSQGRTADVAFTIESWARSHDPFLDLMYDKLGIAQALQGEMWSIVRPVRPARQRRASRPTPRHHRTRQLTPTLEPHPRWCLSARPTRLACPRLVMPSDRSRSRTRRSCRRRFAPSRSCR